MINKLKIILSAMLILTIASVAQDGNKTSVTKLYIATFDRAPDKAGLDYWVNISKLSLEEIAMSFFDQPETQDKYPNGYSTVDFINSIYSNLFKRTPDQIGGDYWIKELDIKNMKKSVFILAIVNGAKDGDADILENKTEIGLAFVESGSNDVERARSIMKGITGDKYTVATALKELSDSIKTDEKKQTQTEVKKEIDIKPSTNDTSKEDTTKKETSKTEEKTKTDTPTTSTGTETKTDADKKDEKKSTDDSGSTDKKEDTTLPSTEDNSNTETKKEEEQKKDDLPTF